MKNIVRLVLIPSLVLILAAAAWSLADSKIETHLGTIAFGAVGLVFYFLPSIIGSQKRNAVAIFFLNLFLGWTLIGWVAALTWASTKDSDAPMTMAV